MTSPITAYGLPFTDDRLSNIQYYRHFILYTFILYLYLSFPHWFKCSESAIRRWGSLESNSFSLFVTGNINHGLLQINLDIFRSVRTPTGNKAYFPVAGTPTDNNHSYHSSLIIHILSLITYNLSPISLHQSFILHHQTIIFIFRPVETLNGTLISTIT